MTEITRRQYAKYVEMVGALVPGYHLKELISGYESGKLYIVADEETAVDAVTHVVKHDYNDVYYEGLQSALEALAIEIGAHKRAQEAVTEIADKRKEEARAAAYAEYINSGGAQLVLPGSTPRGAKELSYNIELRDLFAGLAMGHLWMRMPTGSLRNLDQEEAVALADNAAAVAKRAYQVADALIQARGK